MRHLMTLCRPLALAALLLTTGERADAGDLVRLAATKNSGDIGLYIAFDLGFLKQEGIDAELTEFDTGAKMVAPLATGELDVGTLPGSAALYNAAARQIDTRVVADRSRSAPGHFYQTLMVRKDLMDSGRFKNYPDLKGLRMAVPAPGLNVLSIVNDAAIKGGVKYEDIEKVYVTLPQQVAAFRNKSIDVSIMIEPFATILDQGGDAVRFASTEDFNPGGEFTYMVFSEKFAQQRPDVARRFMRAYVQALRIFNDSIEKGRWGSTPRADEVIGLLATRLDIKPEQIRNSFPHAVDPDGRVNLDAMRKELKFFQDQGLVPDKNFRADTLVDLRFVDMAVKGLGPYKRQP